MTGDPASVDLDLVSVREDTDAGAREATVVFDSLRIDPPYTMEGVQGPQMLAAARRSVRCRAGGAAPECDPPTTLGTFEGPMTSDKPPPFSKWKPAK